MNAQATDPGSPQKKSGRGCVVVLSLLGGLFFLGLVGIAIAAWMAASSPKGQQAIKVVQEMKAAQNAPGTRELKALGCTQAMVIDMSSVGKDVMSLFDSGAMKESKLPAKLSVYCQPGPFASALPTCAEVARTFVNAAPPSESFLATVQRQGETKSLCSSLYTKTGEFVSDVTAAASSAKAPRAR
jgi:hypothetical protein